MNVNIAKIKLLSALSTEFNFSEQPPDFTFEEAIISFTDLLKVKGEVVNSGEIYTVTGNVQTVLQLNCNRCLEEFAFPIDTDFVGAYSQVYLENSEEAEIRLFTGDEIDLEELIMETLLLELPMKYLCSSDCKGLCSQCGQNLNIKSCNCQEPIDPRLSVLAELLKD